MNLINSNLLIKPILHSYLHAKNKHDHLILILAKNSAILTNPSYHGINSESGKGFTAHLTSIPELLHHIYEAPDHLISSFLAIFCRYFKAIMD